MAKQNFLAVLDDFEVASTRHYLALPQDRKLHFERLLYDAMESERKSRLPELRDASGLKFRFNLATDADGVALPTGAMLNKLSFYSSKTLVTFPIRNTDNARDLVNVRAGSTRKQISATDRIFWGEVGRNFSHTGKHIYKMDRTAFTSFLSVLLTLRRPIESGIAAYLPTFPDRASEINNKRFGLLSANFRLRDLIYQFKEGAEQGSTGSTAASGFPRILLPHLGNIPVERVVEIREKLSEEHQDFQRTLETLLSSGNASKAEARLLEYLKDVDSGVRTLDRKVRELERKWQRRDMVTAGVQYLSLGVVLCAPLEPALASALSTIGTVVGSGTAFDFIKCRVDKASEFSQLQNEKFYLPWLLTKTEA